MVKFVNLRHQYKTHETLFWTTLSSFGDHVRHCYCSFCRIYKKNQDEML